MTEAQARTEHGDAVKIYTSRFRPMIGALAGHPERSLMKLVCAGDDERVVGIHLIGPASDEMLQGFAVAVKMGARKRDFDDTVAIHRSEEHTSELPSLMRISYAVFCLKKTLYQPSTNITQ